MRSVQRVPGTKYKPFLLSSLRRGVLPVLLLAGMAQFTFLWANCQITSPVSATLTTSTPTFQWDGSSCDETSYEIVIFDSGGVNAVAPIALTCTGGTCSFTPAITLANGDYTWNVRRVVKGGYVASADVPFTIAASQTWYQDNDGDGYGNPSVSQVQVSQPANHVLDNTDCNDSNSVIHPNGTEICGDNIDQDCSGADLVCTADNDNDGWTNTGGDCNDFNYNIHPTAIDICGDGVDQDCEAGDKACTTLVCLDIEDAPLESRFQAAPANIMILFDNSGSMDFTFMTAESNGAFGGRYYVRSMGDNTYTDSNRYLSNSTGKYLWQARWHGYNRIYYNPSVEYSPWPATASYPNLQAFTDPNDADPSTVRSHPVVGNTTLDLDDTYHSYTNAWGDSHDIPNAHYFVRYNNEVYLVTMTNGHIRYFKFDDPNEYNLSQIRLTQVTGSDIPPVISRTYLQERQNFANWFSFYRRRSFSAVGGLARLIQQMSGVNIGIFTLTRSSNQNRSIIQPVVPVRVMGNDESDTLLRRLYEFKAHSYGTPLRRGLKRLGRYFDDTDGSIVSGLGPSPYASLEDGGACQQAIAIMVTDGHWNGSQSPNVGDQDGDGWTNTVADVAMYYYRTDLSDLPDQLIPSDNDPLQRQHMVTYGIAFGVKGSIDPDMYPDCPGECTEVIPDCDACPDSWPQPLGQGESKIDDMYHATVNGRGKIYSAADPEELAVALNNLLQDIESIGASSTSLGVNGAELTTDTVIYQPMYHSDSWTGDVSAFSIDVTTGLVNTVADWSAAAVLDASFDVAGWWSNGSGRKIFTNNGNTGIVFNTVNSSTIGLSGQMIDYIRGDDRLEGDGPTNYRERAGRLGDVVNASPVVKNGLVFVGANDGMLHAFDKENGKERFAYIPSFVINTLPELALQDYDHKYFVNATPYVADINSTTTYLVGGLGKGGKGIYCLDISASVVNPNSEAQAKDLFKWIYPTSDDDDLGYTYSVPYIVNSNAGRVVIFGNGYDSATGKASLYVLRASDGALLKRIETQYGDTFANCNGLSTPTLVDLNYDGKVDYAYAGDLQGNLWKFDLTATDAADWDVYFEDANNTPQPLFQARNEEGDNQPITHKPDVILHCDRSKHGIMVIFGTGRFLGLNDFIDESVQTMYGIWDWSAEWAENGTNAQERKVEDKYLGSFGTVVNGKRSLSNISTKGYLTAKAKGVTLLEQTELTTAGSSVRVLTNTLIQWYERTETGNVNPYHVGWYFDMPVEGERVVRDVSVRDNRAIVVTSIPSTSVCQAGGISYLMEINACNGGRTDFPTLDYNGDAVIDDSDTVEVEIPVPGGGTQTVSVGPSGIKFNSLINTPIILTMEENIRERKYFSTSSGTITTIDEKAERTGIYSWKEVE